MTVRKRRYYLSNNCRIVARAVDYLEAKVPTDFQLEHNSTTFNIYINNILSN